ncbi:MAG: proprotein convertase P-domain-containing protein [Cyanobacteria bacterium P01_H01_bin.15]
MLHGVPIYLSPIAIPQGVNDRLVISERGTIQDLKVTVDIMHTWIGDLVVRLVSPDGVRVTLHERTGSNNSNLVRTYDVNSTSQLYGLLGTEVSGRWTLEVADLANADVGTLNRWSIGATILKDSSVRLESTPSLLIPDNDPEGVTDVVTMSNSLIISDIAVEVDITHTWSGDLLLQLTGPDGSTVKLQERVGRDKDNIQTVFTPGTTTELRPFLGTDARGDWTLTVADLANRDIGKFNTWTLTFR